MAEKEIFSTGQEDTNARQTLGLGSKKEGMWQLFGCDKPPFPKVVNLLNCPALSE
tara:strand:- start:6515 stop:6679 length:165 start_codon:yes stop_codon:yes gene_type:complete